MMESYLHSQENNTGSNSSIKPNNMLVLNLSIYRIARYYVLKTYDVKPRLENNENLIGWGVQLKMMMLSLIGAGY